MQRQAFVILFFLFLVPVLPSFSQTDTSRLEFDAVIRERVELWDGMNAKNYGDDSPDAIGSLHDRTLYQRIVAGFLYHPFTSATIAMHLQDSRAFGWSLGNSEYPDLFRVKAKDTEEPFYTMNPNEEFFEIYDLYLEYQNIFDRLSLKLGRQKISYGDNRMFGPGEWGNTGRWTWDALKVSYSAGENFVDAFFGGTKIHDPVKISFPFIKTEYLGGGIYSHFKVRELFAAEPFYALKLQGSADYIRTLDMTRHWTGIRLFNNDLNHFAIDFTYAREFGNENGKSVSAFGIVARAGYQFHKLPAKPFLCVRESYASGGTNDESRIRTFDPAYGSRDQYYGRMNITSWSNLDDREIILYLFPVNGMKLEFNYHRFRIPESEDVTLLRTIKMQDGKHHPGDEFNIFADYQINKKIKLTGAFGWFGAGDIEPINGEPAENSTWVSFQITYALKAGI